MTDTQSEPMHMRSVVLWVSSSVNWWNCVKKLRSLRT